MAKVAVLYVYWGSENHRVFMNSYKKHPAGYPHDLITLLPGAGFNVGAFLDAAKVLDHDYLCCCTAYTEFLTDGWLAKLMMAAELPDAGAVDVMGSYESRSQWGYDGPYSRDFPEFPNPHLRVVCLTTKRQRLLDFNFPPMKSKLDTLRFESGAEGLPRKIKQAGLQQFVVGANGQCFDPVDWPDSLTFRLDDQQNLIAHDKHSRMYRDSTPEQRAYLTQIAYKGNII
jgi:hypothetical protein